MGETRFASFLPAEVVAKYFHDADTTGITGVVWIKQVYSEPVEDITFTSLPPKTFHEASLVVPAEVDPATFSAVTPLYVNGTEVNGGTSLMRIVGTYDEPRYKSNFDLGNSINTIIKMESDKIIGSFDKTFHFGEKVRFKNIHSGDTISRQQGFRFELAGSGGYMMLKVNIIHNRSNEAGWGDLNRSFDGTTSFALGRRDFGGYLTGVAQVTITKYEPSIFVTSNGNKAVVVAQTSHEIYVEISE